MDFTEAYHLSTAPTSACTYGYSPGSTFLLTAYSNALRSTSMVQVRYSETLQVVRTWSLPFVAVAASWSRDGAYILASAKQHFVVLALDPKKCPQSEDDSGIVASIRAGYEGLASAVWCGQGMVASFSLDEVAVSLYNLNDGSVTIIEHPKRQRASTSPVSDHVAILTRQESKDTVVMLRPNAKHTSKRDTSQSSWHFFTAMSDAAGLLWSPNGRLIAVWDHPLEFRLQIFTPLGHPRATFAIHTGVDVPFSPISNEPSTCWVAGQKIDEAAAVTGGGLGIRCVRWRPDSSLLAVGDYDEKIRLLETDEWNEVATLDLSKRVIEAHANLPSRPHVWREQHAWRGDTGGRGIVTLGVAHLPISPAALRPDTIKGNPRAGICWMEWSPDGTLLAVRNDVVPAAVYIYALAPLSASSPDKPPRAYLHSAVILSQTVRKAVWRLSQRSSLSELVIVCGTEALYLWRLLSEGEICEGIPIPIASFRAADVVISPDGTKLMLVSENETYCCAIDSDGGTLIDRGDDSKSRSM